MADEGGSGDAGRPIAMVMQLTRRVLQDELLRAARRARAADTAGFNLPGSPRRLYINERLTHTNRQLFIKHSKKDHDQIENIFVPATVEYALDAYRTRKRTGFVLKQSW
ncbi:hypothetical protein EVAR_42834_1 [Eumeta japonica]|uniref:Uncharacterized protein n=1 Tax=Eumeta variegata TaxID=151549 RepID=A0A4C1WGE6_EUMVA|nr:hypothetical protein EVAR_42834_1 [Eumeta japonica]